MYVFYATFFEEDLKNCRKNSRVRFAGAIKQISFRKQQVTEN